MKMFLWTAIASVSAMMLVPGPAMAQSNPPAPVRGEAVSPIEQDTTVRSDERPMHMTMRSGSYRHVRHHGRRYHRRAYHHVSRYHHRVYHRRHVHRATATAH